jgi:hypothetical protein
MERILRVAASAGLALAVFLSGSCEAQLSPVEATRVVVTPVAQSSKTLTLNEAMVFFDQGGFLSPNRGLRLREGTYILEAEDDDYLYYKAPQQIEYRVFRDGKVVDGRFLPGGIYLSKSLSILNPAGAYLAVDDTHKTLMWKLGTEFLHFEGSKWKRD